MERGHREVIGHKALQALVSMMALGAFWPLYYLLCVSYINSLYD